MVSPNILISVLCNVLALSVIQTGFFFSNGADIISDTTNSLVMDILEDFRWFVLMSPPDYQENIKLNFDRKQLEQKHEEAKEAEKDRLKKNKRLLYKALQIIFTILVILVLCSGVLIFMKKSSFDILFVNLLSAFVGFSTEILFFLNVAAAYLHITKTELIYKINNYILSKEKNNIKMICDSNKKEEINNIFFGI
tara:strand:- start:2 stop:586 length:585 start_codon:yes stop_codon:yes gene_type:complete